MTTTCTVPGCEAPHYARGWCVTHYRRWQRHGDPRADQPISFRERGGDGYPAARRRLLRDRGPATARWCEDCGAPAACWSYDGSDPDERTDPVRGTRYSLDPARYRPRCRYCHRRALPGGATGDYRRAAARARTFDVDRAAALYRAGASCRGIGSFIGVSAETTRRALRDHGVPLRPSGRTRRHTPN